MRLALLALLVLAYPASAQQPPPLVAPTDALSPEEEKKGFTVPAGFEVQLVASEPQIQKPMQMAFDAKGRLWVTTSHHYPFAAPQGKGTDKLFVLSDIDPATGKAGKVQVFADDLNIPIGVLPLPDCKSVIVSSTGEIRKYTDTNDDGKADKMEVLFSGFGYVDTHGMYNSFTLMPDGWVYACHGFRNDSKVRGKDGHEVVMNSGHTFRFRPDGSRIEVYTRGQVNPFGIAVDPWFNLYTADCHSKPITQLIPGAYYESFGKPHDGLGFAAHVTRHDHGSTGLCGLAWYDADQFPKQYQGCMFVGNVVTSRINFDKIEWHGATPVAKELPDFMTSKDLWFRPVDIKLGPDGALYVSDFYNKIIGHYEVDLKHPGRDRDHGRLWRVVWKGEGAKEAKFAYTDLTKADETHLMMQMENANLMVRLSAANQFTSREPRWWDVVPHQSLPKKPRVKVSARAYAAIPMLAERAGLIREEDYLGFFLPMIMPANSPSKGELGVGMARGLAIRGGWSGKTRIVALALLGSRDPHVQRAAVEAIIFHPERGFVQPIVDLLNKVSTDDTHLKQAARIALRNCLRDERAAWPRFSDPSERAKGFDPIYSEIALAIPRADAADFLLTQIEDRKLTGGQLNSASEHVARYGGTKARDALILTLTRSRMAPHAEPLLAAFRGFVASGVRLSHDQSVQLAAAAEKEIQQHGSNVTPVARDAGHVHAALRVLAALPAASQPRTKVELATQTVETLDQLVIRSKTPAELRVAATEVLLRLVSNDGLKAPRRLLVDPATPADVRDRLLVVFAASTNREARLDARDALKDAPYRTAVAVGTALAGSPAGAEDLLDAVKQGKAPARLLQERVILERLRAANIPNLNRQVAALTKGLPPLDQKIAELMKKRSVAYTSAKPDKELGAKIFTKHCGACHKIGEAGGKIAPQLDGVGNRGLERLLEDTLDPNRNVDQAFRARIITTKDERTITGLMLRVEGEVVVVADAEGKEVRIPTKEIESNRETMLSPMPANFGDAIPEADFNHLLAYLLEQKAKEQKK